MFITFKPSKRIQVRTFLLLIAHAGISPSAESRKFGFMAHSRGTAETCHILIFDY